MKGQEIVRKIKENNCFVFLDYESDTVSQDIELEDKQTIHLSKEWYQDAKCVKNNKIQSFVS